MGVNTTVLIVFQSRKSGNFRKRKSVGPRKGTPAKVKVPKIVFSTTDNEDTDTYDTFQVRIVFSKL